MLFVLSNVADAQELVMDVYPGSQSSYPDNLTDVNGTMFFTAFTPANGYELWKSNGTTAGTVMVKDIKPGTLSANLNYLTNVSGVLFFTASDGSNGSELWKSDGTAAGTVMVKDILVGATGSNPFSFYNFNGTLFFSANDANSGTELWKSDGTAAGTMMVKDIAAGFSNSYPEHLFSIAGTLYFTAYTNATNYELWKTNGTNAGTMLVKDIYPGSGSGSVNFDPYFTNVNGELYFRAYDGISATNSSGGELWKSDGTLAGTVLVKDIFAGSATSGIKYLTSLNGILYFAANDGINGEELWQSDGTIGGTIMLRDITSGSTGSLPKALINVNGTLYFSANDGINGKELWKSDGTVSGTLMVKNINIAGASNPENLFNYNNVLYFTANDGTSTQVWKTNGTVSGTIMPWTNNIRYVLTAISGIIISPISAVANNTMYFRRLGTEGEELWKFNGSSLSIDSLNLDDSLTIYPNPCNEELFLELPTFRNTTAEIFNLQGQLMQSIPLRSNKTSIQIDNLTSGIYLVHVKGPEGTIVKKVVKN